MGYQVRKLDNFNIFWDYFLVKQKQFLFSFSFIFNKNEPRYFFTNWLFESMTSQLFFSNIIKGQCPYPTCHAKGQNEVFDSTHPPTSENVRCDQIFFGCETCYIGTSQSNKILQLHWLVRQSLRIIFHRPA